RAKIARQRRETVLAAGAQSVVQFELCRAQVRRDTPLATIERHQRVGFLRSGAEYAARPVILERASDQMHAIRQQRGGQRIAVAADIAPTIEAEAQRLAAIDAAAVSGAECA